MTSIFTILISIYLKCFCELIYEIFRWPFYYTNLVFLWLFFLINRYKKSDPTVFPIFIWKIIFLIVKELIFFPTKHTLNLKNLGHSYLINYNYQCFAKSVHLLSFKLKIYLLTKYKYLHFWLNWLAILNMYCSR